MYSISLVHCAHSWNILQIATGGVSLKPKMNPQTSVTVYTGILKLVQNIAPLIVTCTYAIKGNLKFMSPYWL